MELRVVSSTSRKFIVKHMTEDDFFYIEQLDQYYIKKVTGIRTMQTLHFDKSKPGTLFHKSTVGSLEPFKVLSMKPPKSGKLPSMLSPLQTAPSSSTLKHAKLRDLQTLLQFVPPVHHAFYHMLKPETISQN
ncbi:hypothetical protein J6590_093791 [Homalodisca vitripennis]|nr:hypothetical protein J6590_093791 [Homalodisca vitripennis]